MTTESNNRHSFILRIWREGENLEWISSVQHANSGESIPLASLDELQAFIVQYTHQVDTLILRKTNAKNSRKKTGLK